MWNLSSCPEDVHNEASDQSAWSEISYDVAELIFSKLPEASICRAASVCKRWYSVTKMPTFCEFYKKIRIANSCSKFVYMVDGVNYTLVERSDDRGGFLLQPVEKRYNVPTVFCREDGDVPTTEAAGGLHLAYTGVNQTILRYKLSLVEKDWRMTTAMPYVVQDPIAGVVEGNFDGSGHKLVVAGGLSIYSEVNEELAVTIYDEKTTTWECCEPLPVEFRNYASSLFLAAVVHKGRFYVYDMYSGLVSWLDINSRRWSSVVALQPSRKVSELFLVSRSGALCLVGVQGASERHILFTVWSVEDEFEKTMRVGEIVYSTVLSKNSAPPGIIQRWASSFVEVSSAIIGVLLLLLIKFLIWYNRASKRTSCFLRGLLNSTAIARRKQEPAISLVPDRVS